MNDWKNWLDYSDWLHVLYAAFGLLACYLLIRVWGSMLNRFAGQILAWKGTRITAIRFQRVTLISEDRIVSALERLAILAKWLGYVLLAGTWLIVTFNFFHLTRDLDDQILGHYVIAPLRAVFLGIFHYIPKLIFIVLTVVTTRIILKGIGFFFRQIEIGAIHFREFHQDWAKPTYQLVRGLVLVFALIIVFPYLPASSSDAFKGISVFVGLLVSFGSSSAIGNMISGIVLTYMRPFKEHDFVQISDTMGQVVEKNLLVTRVLTPKNELVTIPSAQILSNHIINYSGNAKHTGVIFHTKIAMGYQVPWNTVESLMVEAARRTQWILQEPKPFVLHDRLNNTFVEYQLNAHTQRPELMPDIYSELHRNLQAVFNEAKLDLTTPIYYPPRA